MTWPTTDVVTAAMDAGTDSPAVARAEIKRLADNANEIKNHVSSFMQGVVDKTTQGAAHTALGVLSADQAQTGIAGHGTTTGTSSAFVLTLARAPAAYTDGQVFFVKFHSSSSGSPTLAINGQAARPLVYLDDEGVTRNLADVMKYGWWTRVMVWGINIVILDPPHLPRHVVQTRITTENAGITVNTVFPQDNTIPQNTEGQEVMTLSLANRYADSLFLITVVVTGHANVANGPELQVALFRDSDANALCLWRGSCNGSGGNGVTCVGQYIVGAGAVAARTYRVRAGLSAAGTVYVNRGAGAAPIFSNTGVISISAQEIIP